ncbi:MAG TPA: ATPase, T2SS/T4P/T4SS family [Burkholderiaceae bacterium]|nr:ATPase, T2SS/T4P/T4SS family [Burkholderiaceae bacterium]
MFNPLTRLRGGRTQHRLNDPAGMTHYAAGRAVTLADTEALLNMKPALRRSLSARFGVQALAARLCPVELEDGTVAIFALAEHVGSDQADELARRIEEAGLRAAEPARYILKASLLLAVARDAFSRQGNLVENQYARGALAEAFHELVEWGVRNGASDLHLNVKLGEAESEVKYTVCGRYIAPECFRRMPTGMLMEMLSVAWMDVSGGNGAVFDPRAEQQGSISRQYLGRDVMLRWASMAAEQGPSVCLRILEKNRMAEIPALEALGYPPEQINLLEQALSGGGGAVVFAGTVGSGKSTTLASLIARLPTGRKVVTVEDPVEYTIPGAIQNSIARRLDTEAHEAFATKLRALKRSAMSDVLLGEIRDRETGLAFMDLSGSGINVYTTVHAPSVTLITERLASDFIAVSRDFLAMPGTLKLLVWQALLPRLCRCAVPMRLEARRDASIARRLQVAADLFPGPSEALRVRNPEGCTCCRGQGLPELYGYEGRSVVAEMLVPALQPDFPEWVRSKGRSSVPLGFIPALANAMDQAYRGIFDPADIEQRFHRFDLERRMRAAQSTRTAPRSFPARLQATVAS